MSRPSTAATGALLLLQKSAGHVALAKRLCERFPEALATIGEWERSGDEFVVIAAAGGRIDIAFAHDAQALREQLPLFAFELKDRLGTLDDVGFTAKGHDSDFALRWGGFWHGCVQHLQSIDEMDQGDDEPGPTVH
jgi:hypothetical protein